MEEAIHLGELSGFAVPQVVTRADLAAVYTDLGAFERALETVHLALNVVEARMPSSLTYVLATLAQIHLQRGNLAEAEAVVQQSQAASTSDTIPAFLLPAILTDGELLLQQGNSEKAAGVIDDLLATLYDSRMNVYLPQALYLHGQALLALGQADAGHARLQEARAQAETIGSRRLLWQILATLAEIELYPREAKRLRQQAGEIVQYIAAHAPADLRDSFLALPQVRAVR
jgi:ATP/maltotriose-dependent transcriptional regulator MalT